MIFKKLEAIRYYQNLSGVFKNAQNSYKERSGYIIKLYFDFSLYEDSELISDLFPIKNVHFFQKVHSPIKVPGAQI